MNHSNVYKTLAVGLLAVGLGLGSYGIAAKARHAAVTTASVGTQPAQPPQTPAPSATPSATQAPTDPVPPSPSRESGTTLAAPRPEAAPPPKATPTTGGTRGAVPTPKQSERSSGGSEARQGALAGLTIVVDPGHGGDTSWNGGATGATGLLEKDVNLALGLSLRQALENLGARVVMTREADVPASYTGEAQEDPLAATTEIAAASGADLFVSLHGNWFEDPSAEGIETYYYPGSQAGRRAAGYLAQTLAEATGLPTRGPLANNYYVLHYHPVPATLLEIGYLSNPNDEALLRTQAFRVKVLAGIVKGIRQYFGR